MRITLYAEHCVRAGDAAIDCDPESDDTVTYKGTTQELRSIAEAMERQRGRSYALRVAQSIREAIDRR